EALNKIDGAQADLKTLQQELETAQTEQQRIAADVTAAQPGLQREAAELQSALKAAEAGLPSDVLDPYRRLVQAHGAGALASVDKNACTACYAILSPQYLVELKMGKLIFCRSCGRLLYRPDDE